MSQYKPYPAYKDSGVEWLGRVPEHWDVLRLGQFGLFSKGSGSTKQDEQSAGVPCIRYGDLYTTHTHFIEGSRSCVAVDRAQDYTPLRYGDILFAASGETAEEIGKSAANLLTADARCGGDIIIFRSTTPVDPRFMGYTLDSKPSAFQKSGMGRGYTVVHIYPSQLRNLLVAMPPQSEQRRVAAFLDRETARIDALIEKKQRLIELLKEKRQAVITQAVTKGLDSNVPMKDSGVQWLGEVPAHWRVMKTKYVARLESGHTPSRNHPEYWENCRIPWFGLADVWQIRDDRKEYVGDTKERVSALGLAHSSARLLPAGTVILSRTASVGFSGIMATDMATTQDFADWVPSREITPEYLLYVFRSMRGEFRRLTMGSTHQTIYMPDIAAFTTPVPPIDEQEAIVEATRSRLSRIDLLVDLNASTVELLTERRSALITAAVTGQIDVRDAA